MTGGAVGIGNAYAQALLTAGWQVSVCDLREAVEDPATFNSEPDRVLGTIADVSDPADVARVIDNTMSGFGRIDALVNNAGVWRETNPTDSLPKTLDDFGAVVGTNLYGEFLFGRAVIPRMIEQGSGGDIVNIATDHMVTCGTPWDVCPRGPQCPFDRAASGFQGPPRPTGGGGSMDLYDISKWALNGLTYAWAKALRPHNIRVNAICMGATDSHMLRGFHNHAPSPEEEASWMKTSDAAEMLMDLLAEGPSGRTGQAMNACIGRPCKLEPAHTQLYVRDEDIA
ncbi:MAG: SDR family oxidoreductase [Pseudomonadaceae bacterium]|nr:SDR family oxidoreductase [Pseudomonadaceae bacterium]